MSFILDALRKSELERQKNAPPGIANVPVTRRHSPRTVWVPIAVALLAANLLLLAWFSISPDETPPAVTTAELPSTTPEAATATPEPVRPLAQEARSASVSCGMDPIMRLQAKGVMQFERTLKRAMSSAIDFDRPAIPSFAAA